MNTKEETNRRIAKNTIMLYIRMFLTMVVGIYTSRVVLNTLGVEDYGVYNVVGGIVSLFVFVNAAMTQSTARFIAYELGTGDKKKLNQVFSSALTAHICIAIFVLLLSETIGVWLLESKLVIPEGRMEAARWVLQLSILSTVLVIVQTPFGAAMNAHEHMGVYAYVEILSSCLKLLIVFLLQVGDYDKLLLYAVLSFLVSIIIMLIYHTYSRIHFDECKFRLNWKLQELLPMLNFSGWTMFGSAAVTAQYQGTSFLLNMFFTTVANAATGIANTVNGIIYGFATNVCIAFEPQIVKNYAKKDWQSFCSLINVSSRFTSILFQMLGVPFLVEIYYVLNLWLGIVPQYTVAFAVVIIAVTYIDVSKRILQDGIRASGHIKWLSISSGFFNLSILMATYIMFHEGWDAVWAYINILIIHVVIVCVDLYLLKREVNAFSVRSVCASYLRSLVVVLMNGAVCISLHHVMEEGFLRLVLVCMASVITSVGCGYIIAMSDYQRALFRGYVISRIKRWI